MTARTTTDHTALLLGQWFFTGRAPKAPGTVGSFGTLPLVWALLQAGPLAYWLVTAFISLVGIPISTRCAKLLGDKDPQSVVIDEVAGVLIALGCVAGGPLWLYGVAFVLFRAFDITKPSVIDRVQYLEPPGLGIMADDLLAGVVAGAISLGIGVALGALSFS